MLIELAASGNLITTWLALTALAAGFVFLGSGPVFWALYVRPTYATWQHKSIPAYPSVRVVRKEILLTLKGLLAATLPPALALHLGELVGSRAYAGLGGYGWAWLALSVVIIVVASDLYEWAYHRLGHTRRFWWDHHKAHHHFTNPSPFSVIADRMPDQFLRALPLLAFPLVMPVNMDLLFVTYGALFYGYGVYLHSGFELPGLSAHHRWLNTSFQHLSHHARSSLGRPLHTGFFFKLWDQLAGSVIDDPPETCRCAGCARARGERTPALWRQVDKPDYGPLLSPSFWLTGEVAGQPSAER